MGGGGGGGGSYESDSEEPKYPSISWRQGVIQCLNTN